MAGGDVDTGQGEQIADLVAEIRRAGKSDDASSLKSLLVKAGERLSFYEGFDREIAENVRRSGELMLESLTLRDRMATERDQVDARERAALLRQISALEGHLDGVTAQVAASMLAVAELKATLGEDLSGRVGSPPNEGVTPAKAGRERELAEKGTEEAVGTPASTLDSASTGGVWPESGVIDVIAHDVSKAATALALQQHLRSLDRVEQVDAREFASGVLRLHVTARGPLSEADVLGWTGSDGAIVSALRDRVIEIRFQH